MLGMEICYWVRILITEENSQRQSPIAKLVISIPTKHPEI